jgi:hypothetical protein
MLRGNLVQQLEPSKMGPAAGGSSTLLVQQLGPSKMGPAAGYCLDVAIDGNDSGTEKGFAILQNCPRQIKRESG